MDDCQECTSMLFPVQRTGILLVISKKNCRIALRNFFFRGYLIKMIEPSKKFMDCFPILQSHKISNRKIDLLENSVCVYDIYDMYSISIKKICILNMV
jgi:hypothetical protein